MRNTLEEDGRRPMMARDWYHLQRTMGGPPLTTIYFILSPMAGLVKIGHATDARSRFSQLDGSSSVPIEGVGMMRGNLRIEDTIHRKFGRLRRRGEWFEFTPRLQSFVRTFAAPWSESLFASWRCPCLAFPEPERTRVIKLILGAIKGWTYRPDRIAEPIDWSFGLPNLETWAAYLAEALADRGLARAGFRPIAIDTEAYWRQPSAYATEEPEPVLSAIVVPKSKPLPQSAMSRTRRARRRCKPGGFDLIDRLRAELKADHAQTG